MVPESLIDLQLRGTWTLAFVIWSKTNRVMTQALQIYHTVYVIPFAWWAHQYANNVHIHYGYEGYYYNVRNKCDF